MDDAARSPRDGTLVPHYTGARAKAWCLLIHAKAPLSWDGGRKPGASFIHAEASLSLTEAGAKANCLLLHAEASLSRVPGRNPGASLYLQNNLSLTGARAKAWCLLVRGSVSLTGARAKARCLLIHAEASLTLSGSRGFLPAFALLFLPLLSAQCSGPRLERFTASTG